MIKDLRYDVYQSSVKLLGNEQHQYLHSGACSNRNLLQVGTGITNALINARKAIDKSFAGEAEDVPILPTSVAYGVYMAVSSNLRYNCLMRICIVISNTAFSFLLFSIISTRLHYHPSRLHVQNSMWLLSRTYPDLKIKLHK